MTWQALQALTIGPDSPHLTILQVCLRAAIIFLMGIVYIRVVGPRTFGRNTPLDIVVAVVIGSNLSRVLTGSAAFLPVLAGTFVLVGLHWLFVWLARHSRLFGAVVKGEPRDLIKAGAVDHRELARQNISYDDLMEDLRSHGVESPAKVAHGVLERSGKISVIRREG